jgi:hypothetical protein
MEAKKDVLKSPCPCVVRRLIYVIRRCIILSPRESTPGNNDQDTFSILYFQYTFSPKRKSI